MLPVSTQTLLSELESMEALLKKWAEKVSKGIPGIDYPLSGNTTEATLEAWFTEMVGEIRLVAGKAHNLSELLATTIFS